jgi:hypothetical protein
MHIAERSLYILIARVAWACDIRKKKDEKGNVIEVPLYGDGFNVQPNWFPFELKARNEKRWQVVKEAYEREMGNDPLKERWNDR